MTHGSLWDRLFRGSRWSWLSEDYRAALPEELPETVMDLESSDRLHVKQGRSTARMRFDSPWGGVSVYLKRHFRLPLADRIGALVHPRGLYSPAAAEFAHLQRARELGVAVPDVVAVGEEIGPWGRLRSYLMVAELTGQLALHEALPQFHATMPAPEYDRRRRELIAEMAAMVVKLHERCLFHKDLYLCHFFISPDLSRPAGQRLTLIDLHRLGEHKIGPARWRWKDLGQLLYSTYDVAGVDDRDRLRFWRYYRRAMKLRFARTERRLIIAKAKRYAEHNSNA